jgi:hypothetical protein
LSRLADLLCHRPTDLSWDIHRAETLRHVLEDVRWQAHLLSHMLLALRVGGNLGEVQSSAKQRKAVQSTGARSYRKSTRGYRKRKS